MSKFRTNIFLIATTSNYFWASAVEPVICNGLPKALQQLFSLATKDL